MLALEQKSIVWQLCEIYWNSETWHKTRLSYDEMIKYHEDRLLDGRIVVYLDNDEVLGYYEREINGDKCFLKNVFIKEGMRRGIVWRQLYKHFLRTMPLGVTKVVGYKQKIGGKYIERIITKERG
jgi:hypothetical protein